MSDQPEPAGDVVTVTCGSCRKPFVTFALALNFATVFGGRSRLRCPLCGQPVYPFAPEEPHDRGTNGEGR